jgi:hypothetical protein
MLLGPKNPVRMQRAQPSRSTICRTGRLDAFDAGEQLGLARVIAATVMAHAGEDGA